MDFGFEFLLQLHVSSSQLFDDAFKILKTGFMLVLLFSLLYLSPCPIMIWEVEMKRVEEWTFIFCFLLMLLILLLIFAIYEAMLSTF